MGTTEIILLSAIAVLLIEGLVVVYVGRSQVFIAAEISQVEMTRGAATLRWAGWRPFTLVSRTAASADGQVVSFTLKPVDGGLVPLFKPGQHLTVQVQADGEDLVRCYSLSSSPYDEHYRISVKRAPAPSRVSGFLHAHLVEGAMVDVRAPAGDFFLDPRGASPCVLIAGGVGVTPIWSMLLACAKANPLRAVWLFYGVQSEAEDVLLADTAVLGKRMPNLKVTRCYGAATAKLPAGVQPGYVTADLVLATVKDPEAHFYICGPAGMMESLVPALEARGISEARIHFETFGPSSLRKVLPLVAAPPAQVRFAMSGKSVTWTCGSLLDLADSEGVSIDSSCRSGQCGSCETTVVSGKTAYLSPPSYTPETGHCLPCVCRPDGDLVLQA